MKQRIAYVTMFLLGFISGKLRFRCSGKNLSFLIGYLIAIGIPLSVIKKQLRKKEEDE